MASESAAKKIIEPRSPLSPLNSMLKDVDADFFFCLPVACASYRSHTFLNNIDVGGMGGETTSLPHRTRSVFFSVYGCLVGLKHYENISVSTNRYISDNI